MDEIATKCAGLQLSEKEESEVDLMPSVTEIGHVLVGPFCTKRRVSLESVARVLQSMADYEELRGLQFGRKQSLIPV